MTIRHKKLREWVSAGLMTEAQADSIHAYEERRKGGRFGRGLVGLSLFAILVGVLSIIAANWHEIPGSVKIAAHLLINAAVGATSLWAARTGRDLWREGAALVFLGLTFTLIILIGQVFQMTGTPGDAALFWCLITLPYFFVMGRGYMTAAPWMLAFLATVYIVAAENLDSLPDNYRISVALGIVALMPLALVGDGTIALFRRWRPVLCDVAVRAGLLLMIAQASTSLAMWPSSRFGALVGNHTILKPDHGLVIIALGLAGIAANAMLHRFYKQDETMKAGAVFTAVSLTAFMLPLIVPIPGEAILPAIAFIGYWAYIGWLGQKCHHMRIVSLAITVIAVRIFIIYVEVFGSLMNTGFGLISGGVVMLALIYAARRLDRRITKTEAVT